MSPTVIDAMIRVWKQARLSRECSQLGYPKTNILHPKHGIDDEEIDETGDDAEWVQKVVDKMPQDIRASFEAFHLGIIRGESCRDKPHKWRWLTLGIDENRYKARYNAGHHIIGENLLTLPINYGQSTGRACA